MTSESLRQLPAAETATLPPLLQALWHDAHGNWSRAHQLAQEVGEAIDTPTAARVHAYLHRKEGDDVNARYWYRRAAQPAFTGPLEAEWLALAAALLAA